MAIEGAEVLQPVFQINAVKVSIVILRNIYGRTLTENDILIIDGTKQVSSCDSD